MVSHNALWRRIYDKGNYEKEEGGYEIALPLSYAENATFQYYNGFEELDIGQSDVLTAAKFDWKQAACHITASGQEIRMNNGMNAMIKLAKAKKDVAMDTLANNLSVGFYSAGTGSGGKQIGGLQSMITAAGAGTVGGINSATYTWWANQYLNVAVTSGNIRSKMNSLYLSCTRGTDLPDFGVADSTTYLTYEAALQTLERWTDHTSADSGFQSYKYKGMDLFFDTTASGIPANTLYMLNTKYLKMFVHKDADLSVENEKESLNQDAVVIPILFMGNLCVSNRARQGILWV
jgi:hypothetical protein